MQVETVTTLDRSLLDRLRATLAGSSSAIMCVAFVQERGLHLIAKELEALAAARRHVRLLVTTTFASTDGAALAMATGLGAEVRVLNPGSGSFHPKLYLGLDGRGLQAVVGSANLTAGLATNVEVAVWMKGTSGDAPLGRVQDIAERLWSDPRAQAWQVDRVAESKVELFDDALWPLLSRELALRPVVSTLGPRPRANRIAHVSREGVLVETERSKSRGGGELVPAWMFNLAWSYLRTHGTLSNTVLLNELRVHRSSAVCAILARLPGVERLPGKGIVLRWNG